MTVCQLILRTDELDGLREAVADVGGTVVGDGDADVTQAFPLHTGCSDYFFNAYDRRINFKDVTVTKHTCGARASGTQTAAPKCHAHGLAVKPNVITIMGRFVHWAQVGQ